MAKFTVKTPINFGPWTIGDKNYGPACPSCKVPINNYAPKVGDVIEGVVETTTYKDPSGKVKLGTGVRWPIATNGAASTQGQMSTQFITIDHLEAYSESPQQQPSQPEIITVSNPINKNETTPVEDKNVFSTRNILLFLLVLVVLFFIFKATNII